MWSYSTFLAISSCTLYKSFEWSITYRVGTLIRILKSEWSLSFSPEDIWQCQESFSVVTTDGLLLAFVGRGQLTTTKNSSLKFQQCQHWRNSALIYTAFCYTALAHLLPLYLFPCCLPKMYPPFKDWLNCFTYKTFLDYQVHQSILIPYLNNTYCMTVVYEEFLIGFRNRK